jgi:hypothetical protein
MATAAIIAAATANAAAEPTMKPSSDFALISSRFDWRRCFVLPTAFC